MYKEWLENDKKLAIGSIKLKLSMVKVYLQEAWNFQAFTNFYKGKTEERRPHQAYKEEDVMQLIDQLKMKRASNLRKQGWLVTACIVSFLYDVAG